MKQLGLQTKEIKLVLTMGLRIVMKTCEDVENDQAEEAGFAADPEQGWGWARLAINTPFTRFCKSCFRKDSRMLNECIFASFHKYAFAEIAAELLRFCKLWQI